jgi:hypothetical protein
MWEKYRDVLKPAPLCYEQATYGGYRWFKVTETVWISRKFEAQFEYLNQLMNNKESKLKCNLYCCRELVTLLQSAGVFDRSAISLYSPEEYSKVFDKTSHFNSLMRVGKETYASEEVKVLAFLKMMPQILVLGDSVHLNSVIHSATLSFDKVYSFDNSYGVKLSEYQAALYSRFMTTVSYPGYPNLKKLITNWGNLVLVASSLSIKE